MNFPNDETGSVLAEMQEAGIDLSAPVKVVFFQLFEDKANAQAMADHIKADGLANEVNLHPDQTPNVWDVDCTLTMVPSHENITKHEAQFEQVARKFDGYNDGWGVQVED